MAIEGVDRVAVGNDRFKCIQRVRGGKSAFLVATANSGGVVSISDLQGASRSLADGVEGGDEESEDKSDDDDSDDSDDSDEDGDEEEDLAVFLTSVRIGSGARITNLAVWSSTPDSKEKLSTTTDKRKKSTEEKLDDKKRKRPNNVEKKNTLKLDSDAVARARALVDQAKRKQQKKNKKQKKKRQE